MKVIDLYKKLCEAIPTSLSCEWDRDGLESCPDPDKEVKKVLIALDVTTGVIEKAETESFDVIISHHPVFFGGLANINSLTPMGAKAVALARSCIAVMSFHTRLDALENGVNDTLASLIGLKNVETIGNDKIARIGELECEVELEDFAHTVKEALSYGEGANEAHVTVCRSGRKVKRVALVGGSGGGEIGLALEHGADTFLTGDLKYHELLSSTEHNMNLVCAGHFFTEYPVCNFLKKTVGGICPDATVENYFSNIIIEL